MVKQIVRRIFQIKSLKLKIFILLTLLVGSLAIFQYEIQTKTIKDMFQPQLSSNPEATEYFINAMGVASYIERLHNFVNYDSFLMKPLLYKMNKDYEKGKSLLPENSAEDVFWYMLYYRGIYGIGANISKNDNSIGYDKDFKTEEDFKKYYEDILDKIKRLSTLDFKYDTPIITNNKLQIMNNLLEAYLNVLVIYIDNYFGKQSKLILDKKYLEDINNVYLNYKQYSEKYLSISNDTKIIGITNDEIENILENKYLEIRLLLYYLIVDLRQTNQVHCKNEKYQLLLKNIKYIKNIDMNSEIINYFRIKYIFEKNLWLNDLLKTLTNCSNLKEEINEILPYFKN